VESPRYHRYHKQPDLSFFCAVGRATVVHRGRDLVEHSKLAPRGELGKKMVFGTVVYMTLLTPDLMRHTFLYAQPIRDCMVRITPTLSSLKSCLSTTTCQIRKWTASSSNLKALPLYVALLGTFTISYSCQLRDHAKIHGIQSLDCMIFYNSLQGLRECEQGCSFLLG